MVKEFAYNGLSEKELNGLSLEKLLAVFPARARRSLTRGINDNKRKLIKEIKTAKIDKTSTESTNNSEISDETTLNIKKKGTNDNYRWFRRYNKNGETTGYFRGTRPKQAASKAFSSICREMKKTNDTITKEHKFAIVECTRGSKRKIFRYIGTKEKPKKKVINKRVILDNKTGKKKHLKFEYNNKIYKDKEFQITTDGKRKKNMDMPKINTCLRRKKKQTKFEESYEESYEEYIIDSPVISLDKNITFETNVNLDDIEDKVNSEKKKKIIKKVIKRKKNRKRT